jgi:tyrosyl-tRNA synthetase
VHSLQDYNAAVEASEILFGKGTTESLRGLSESDFLSVFDGVPKAEIALDILADGIPVIDLVSEKTSMFPSKGEAKRMIAGGGVSLNKEKIADGAMMVSTEHLLNNKYLLFQKGKKSYFIMIAV